VEDAASSPGEREERVSRTVAVIGTINRDRIIDPEGRTHEDLGGILYNVLTLAPFLGATDRIVPIARVGVDQKETIRELLVPYRCADDSRILWSDGGSNETVLRYTGPEEREESLVERIEPLGLDDVAAAAGAELVLVNLIWGKEVTPEHLAVVTGDGANLLLDIQSLTLTFRSGSDRAYRNIPAWRDWVRPARVVKGNEEEIRWFIGEGGAFDGSLRDAAVRIIAEGPEAVLITRATKGHGMAWRQGGGVRWAEVPAVPVPRSEWEDMTGCGDAFTSGYALGCLRGESPPAAALLGAALGALVCRTRGLAALRTLPEPFALRWHAYGDWLVAIDEDQLGEAVG